MEPRIQYANTSDGVSIAYWMLGEGEALVHLPWHPISHVLLEWQDPDWRRWYDMLLANRRLIRYDGRGTGLSRRDVSDLSLDALVRDLEGVVDRIGLETFDLLALHHAGFIAIAYASRHPERVSHLMLWCCYARASDWWSPDSEAFLPLLENWERFTYTKASDRIGWSDGEAAARYAQIMQASIAPEYWRAATTALREFDVTGGLGQLTSPCLVVHRRGIPYPSVGLAEDLASRMPSGNLVFVEGTSRAPYLGDTKAVVGAIDEFLGSDVKRAEKPAFRTVLFTDIVGHTEMMQRLGDERGREVLREHERITREVLKAHGGTEVKTMGDGFMASFGSVTKAVECAIALQRAFAARNASPPAHPEALEGRAEEQPLAHGSRASPRAGRGVGESTEPIVIRIGLNAGEPIEEEGPDGRSDLFGSTVILAARIAAQAEGGDVLASMAVRELCAGKGFLFADRGEHALRGFEDPVRMFEVSWREE